MPTVQAVYATFDATMNFTIDFEVPRRHKEIESFADKDAWYVADNSEYNSLMANKTWELVPLRSVALGRKYFILFYSRISPSSHVQHGPQLV